MIYYIADWHYGHKNVITFDNRPFASLDEMNTVLVNRWNNTVTDNDTVYVLGDMFYCKRNLISAVLDKLNGHKILIRGNHDKLTPRQRRYFDDIVDYMEIVDGDRNVVLSHYPIVSYKNMRHGWLHLYAHVHNSDENILVQNTFRRMQKLQENHTKPQAFNVGVMMPYMNYTPQTLESIIANAPKQYITPVYNVPDAAKEDKYWIVTKNHFMYWFSCSTNDIKQANAAAKRTGSEILESKYCVSVSMLDKKDF